MIKKFYYCDKCNWIKSLYSTCDLSVIKITIGDVFLMSKLDAKVLWINLITSLIRIKCPACVDLAEGAIPASLG